MEWIIFWIILFLFLIFVNLLIKNTDEKNTEDFYKWTLLLGYKINIFNIEEFYKKNGSYVNEGDILFSYYEGKIFYNKIATCSGVLEINKEIKDKGFLSNILVFTIHKKELDKLSILKIIYDFYDFFYFSVEINENYVIYSQKNNWNKSIHLFFNTGDNVKKGDIICEYKYGLSEDYEGIYAGTDGILELSNILLDNFTSIIDNYNNENNDKFIGTELFRIHLNPSKLDLENIKLKRFRNIPFIENDDFSNNINVKWKFVGGKELRYFSDWSGYTTNRSNDLLLQCIELIGDKNRLFLTVNYLDNNDFLIIRYNNKDLSLSLLDKIRLLLGNSEILEFSIIENPYKIDKGIYETKIKITFEEIIKIKDNGIQNWQIDFSNNGNKIKGIVDENIVFLTKSLFCDYFDIVNTKIENYLPISNRDDYVNITKAKEECYVYLMHDTINGYHKIGISNKPEYREKTLQSEKPSIAMITNKKFPNRDIALAFEQALHRTYQEKRIRGEWFNLDEFELNDLKFVIKD